MNEKYILGKTVAQKFDVDLTVAERRQHVYVIGRTGTGKTTLLFSMMQTDLEDRRAFIYIDPHGDTARALADAVPADRTNNVIYFKPSDPDYSISLNPLIQTPVLNRWTLAADIVEIFRTIWAQTWGARLEHILTQSVNLLLYRPGSTLVDIPDLLRDDEFRQEIVDRVTEKHATQYWELNYKGLSKKVRDETLSPVDNKIGQFVSNPLLRDVIGQRSSLDIEDIMDTGKALIVDLSGMGEEPARILGALIVSTVWHVAQKRENTPIEERKDVGLYVDEFQRYVTPTFARILSESRKYRLSFILASQYMEQMDDTVRAALLGNIGTDVIFRIGVLDSPLLAKEVDTTERQLLDQPNYRAVVKLLRGGSPTEATVIETIPPVFRTGRFAVVQKNTRSNYGRRRYS